LIKYLTPFLNGFVIFLSKIGGGGQTKIMVVFMGLEQKRSQCNAVQEGDSGVITTAGTIETVIEDPLLSILE
jgi:hypothetical protein